MSKINFITGELNGRLGEIVGSRHHGTYYTKKFTPPGNPDTANQHGARNVFSHITKIGGMIYAEALKPHLYPKSLKGTDINTLVKNNELMIKAHVWDPLQFQISKGTLWGTNTINFTRTGQDFKVTWQYQLPQPHTNDAIFIVYDETTNRASVDVKIRTDNEAMVWMNITDFTKVYGYLFFSQTDTLPRTGLCSNTYSAKFT